MWGLLYKPIVILDKAGNSMGRPSCCRFNPWSDQKIFSLTGWIENLRLLYNKVSDTGIQKSLLEIYIS